MPGLEAVSFCPEERLQWHAPTAATARWDAADTLLGDAGDGRSTEQQPQAISWRKAQRQCLKGRKRASSLLSSPCGQGHGHGGKPS